jgi:uncharacterized membrane protein SirB2
MKLNKKNIVPILIVAVILLSGLALVPLFVYAKETQFSWQTYIMAYIIPVSIYIPIIIK